MGYVVRNQYWRKYDGVCVRMLLGVSAADQAAEISHGFSLDLRLVKFIQVNYCFYKKFLNYSMFGCKYYTISGVVGY